MTITQELIIVTHLGGRLHTLEFPKQLWAYTHGTTLNRLLLLLQIERQQPQINRLINRSTPSCKDNK